MPDAPQRIASDTSLKIPIRYGETIKAYIEKGKNLDDLKLIPLVFAGWLRYLLGIDDRGLPFNVSPDPQYESLRAGLGDICLGRQRFLIDKLEPILSNPALFGVNLYEAGLAERTVAIFEELLAGPGAVAATLKKYTA
jgi:fructuronate reductase